MSTIYIGLPVNTGEVIDNVCFGDEKDFLRDALESFESDNVTDALREYFRSQKEWGAALPDFIDPTKL